MVRARGLTVVIAAVFVAVACASGSTTTASKGVIKIGTSLPLSGASASDGQPTLKGVQFAIKQQNDKGGIGGFTLEIVSKDYAPSGTIDPAVGKSGMRELVDDAGVLGVVGAFNSSVTRQELPVANQAHLVMVSPANTNDCLTVHQAACDLPLIGYTPETLRPYGPNNFFRVAAKDSPQGGSMADYAYNTLKLKTVGVYDDSTSYGVGVAEYFAERYCKDGGTVVGGCGKGSAGGVAGIKHYDPASTTSFTAMMQSFKAGGADGIYAGGNASNKSCVARQQAVSGGIFSTSTPFLAEDGEVDSECLDTAGAGSVGMIGTTAAEDASKLGADAAAVITAFKKAYGTGPNDFGAYTIPAYAATQTIIAGIKAAIDANSGNKPTREQVRAAMTTLAPVSTPLGNVSYDKNGDTTVQIIAFYKTAPGPTPSGSVLTCATDKSFCWVFIESANRASTTYP